MLQRHINQHPFATFVLIAFGWSWGWDVLYYSFGWWNTLPVTFPRQWGVPIAALIVIGAGDVSIQCWFKRTFQWRVRPSLYLVALLVPLFITNVQPVLRALGGGSVIYSPPAALPLVALFLFANMFLLGGIEEVGWRGFLQPRLQERSSVLTAGLIIGVLWLGWHLSLFLGHRNFAPELIPFLQYTIFILGASVVLGVVVNLTDGSVLPVMLMHASTNVGALLEGSGGILDGPLVPLIGAGLWWLIALALIILYGRSMTLEPQITSLTEPTRNHR